MKAWDNLPGILLFKKTYAPSLPSGVDDARRLADRRSADSPRRDGHILNLILKWPELGVYPFLDTLIFLAGHLLAANFQLFQGFHLFF